MMKSILKIFIFVTLSSIAYAVSGAQEMTPEEAWNRLKTYQYGDDFKPLLIIENEVQQSTASPETKIQCAAKLAALLNEQTPYSARQFVCLQLRLVGGKAEIPKLAEYLNKTEDAENARMALGSILEEDALVPLRQKLAQKDTPSKTLIGVIGTLAERKDVASISQIAALLESEDSAVATAAASALGHFGASSIESLKKAKEKKTVSQVAVGYALIQAAHDLADQGKKEEANSLFLALSEKSNPNGVRRAALEGVLQFLSDQERKTIIAQWFFENDSEKSRIAASRLKELSSEQFDELLNKFDTMSPQAKICFLEITAEKQESKLRELLLRSLKSGDISERLTAIRSLGKLGDVSMIPILISSLQDTALKNAAVEALRHYPVSEVAKPLLDALQKPELRASAIDVIVAMKYYDAIDTLITLAEQEDDSAITGLGRLCDPDDSDLPRLLNLYFKSRTGAHREKVERAIVVVCEKIPQAEERANKILDLLAKRNDGLSNDVLAATFPLLGKIGNQRVAAILLPLLEDKNSELQQAAVRAFCNWPNADYADELWKIAAQSKSIAYRQWALRAYIRVITLKSDRPESETLEMLKKAMELAATDSDRQWALSRASAIRTMDSARWAASYLDNSALSQTACVVLTELAHHRFLREPNKAAFETILLKVEKIAKDKSVAERAKKARLGM